MGWKAEVIDAASAIVAGEVSVLEGARTLSMLACPDEVGLCLRPADFATFHDICHDTDHLPTASDRHLWAPEALARLDPEIVACEEFWRVDAIAAARRLLDRYAQRRRRSAF